MSSPKGTLEVHKSPKDLATNTSDPYLPSLISVLSELEGGRRGKLNLLIIYLTLFQQIMPIALLLALPQIFRPSDSPDITVNFGSVCIN